MAARLYRKLSSTLPDGVVLLYQDLSNIAISMLLLNCCLLAPRAPEEKGDDTHQSMLLESVDPDRQGQGGHGAAVN